MEAAPRITPARALAAGLALIIIGTLALGFSPSVPQDPAPVIIPPKPGPPVDFANDELAKFISGLPCDSETLRALQETPAWQAYAAALDRGWAELEVKRWAPMRAWAEDELAEANAATRTLFYPFGGPDFVTPSQMFPDTSTYVLFGLEFVGNLPAFAADGPPAAKHLESYLANMTAALSDFFNKSYFVTRNMYALLVRDRVEGVLPILCLFLKRTGHSIAAIKRCEFLVPGEVFEYDFAYPRKAFRKPYGVKIEFFRPGSDRVRSLYYFCCNIADEYFGKNTLFSRYLDKLGFETTLVKSASYLMQYRYFSNIRSLILARSRFVLQDDTGVPFKLFTPRAWEARLYGDYTRASGSRISRPPTPIRPRSGSCRSTSGTIGARRRTRSCCSRGARMRPPAEGGR
jgi:hypothetical protein